MTSNYYTLKGYKLRSDNQITEAMEDYIEMIYRKHIKKKDIKIKDLSFLLNVKPSSVSKMITRLQNLDLVIYKNGKYIKLSKEGINIGKYLLYRHNVLKEFFKYINKDDYKLAQVEKIEHFIDYVSVKNIESLLAKKSKA